MRTAVVLVFCIALLGVFASDLSKVAQRGPIAGRWDILRSAQSHETVNFKVLLKQRNLEKLEQIFWDVSTPSHENYGKFLTRQQIAEIVAPEKSSVDRVVSWLQMSGVPATSIGVATDYVQVQTTVKIASALFNTQFAVYKSTRSTSTKLRILGAAHVPATLAADIDFVAGLTELIDNARIQPKTWPTLTKDNLGDDGLITPSVLKNFYNVPSNAVASGAATQGIAAFTDYFSVGALGAFEQYFNLPTANVTRSGPDCLNSEQCDQYESDLDVQYVTAMGSGVPTFFLAHADGEWILDWAQQLSSASNPPLVNSISYGWPELEQCELTEDCSTYGYNSQQYVTRTNTELQKLGSLGLTVLVSDGDDGAPSLYGASGNCPIDASQYCPTGGCDHTRTSCPELIFTLESNNTLCFFPMGMGSNACQLVLSDTTRINNALNAWANANSNCQIAIEYDRTNDPHVYSSCTCDQLQSKSTGGYTIAPYQFDQNNGAVFTPEYPTSSPYVTSVGATQFVWRNNDVTSEISASIVTGAKITTGGGFSTFQAQPSYQSAAVSAYLSSSVGLPPSFAYDSSMRAYPDISFNGHNYLVFASNNTSDLDTCPCGSLPVDGTSCSSPALAGLLSLINDQLVAAGKSPLGFINPLLYQMYAQNPQSFNDVTSGENDCNRSYCCEYGWTATSGWDPVGGLGSPDFTQMSKYILGLKGVQAN